MTHFLKINATALVPIYPQWNEHLAFSFYDYSADFSKDKELTNDKNNILWCIFNFLSNLLQKHIWLVIWVKQEILEVNKEALISVHISYFTT